MSSRRNGSVSRAAEAASKNRLHMDRNPQHSRITDPANPAGRRKEIDNVMKRARQASPGSWDRKLLEVEEKDPNRSPRRSRSPPARRSPRASRSRSPRSPRRRSPPRRSPARRRRSASPRARRSRPPPRPPSPPDPRKSSPSGSSASSCSDESCSVCSAKNKKVPPKPVKPGARTSPSPPRTKRPAPPAAARAVQPTRELLKARESSKRSREEKVLEWQRSQLAVRPTPPIPPAHIKREGERRPRPPRPERPDRPDRTDRVSPAAIAAALADSDSDSESDASSEPPPQRLTLSERFGKMAQWSAARCARLENMRITRRDSALHVHIERDERAADAPDAPRPDYPGLDPAPVGSYPEELLAVAPGGLPSWDDVRVRYDYYKKRGYLRGLTLGDYVKWEEWWYKYQEWLKRERAYERWAEGDGGTSRRERRRRGGRHRRS
ncbi:serine/arginine repetitive matrix protein 1 isoform X2 [Nymphalis io]|uniref:serine/arginine repetitive matrix protein 1 isoform X2 n=1 Tax=Inachis io TaxID=171585 RepID=UPI0021678051|nr:serine/arginine repetitive matrix protein 1 isoform X2 [Nymphalis io]